MRPTTVEPQVLPGMSESMTESTRVGVTEPVVLMWMAGLWLCWTGRRRGARR
jgi:hypothetical protein